KEETKMNKVESKASSTELAELRALHRQIQAACLATTKAAKEYLASVRGLEKPDQKRKLAAEYRSELQGEFKQAALKTLHDYDVHALLQRAKVAITQGVTIGTPAHALRAARFYELLPLIEGDHTPYSDLWDANRHRILVNELRGLREDFAGLRWEGEVQRGSDQHPLEPLTEAVATGTLAVIHRIDREAARRGRSAKGAVSPALASALTEAKKTIAPTAEGHEATQLLEEIYRMAKHIEAGDQTSMWG